MPKNLDDNFEELTNPESKNQNSGYSLTPKGALLEALLDSEVFNKYVATDDINVLMDMATEIWGNFEQHTRTNFGMGDKIGAVIFDTHGGAFGTISTDTNEGNDMYDRED